MAAVRHLEFSKIWFLNTGTLWAADFPSRCKIWCQNIDWRRNYGPKSKSKMAAVTLSTGRNVIITAMVAEFMTIGVITALTANTITITQCKLHECRALYRHWCNMSQSVQIGWAIIPSRPPWKAVADFVMRHSTIGRIPHYTLHLHNRTFRYAPPCLWNQLPSCFIPPSSS